MAPRTDPPSGPSPPSQAPSGTPKDRFQSPSASFDADDERSFSDPSSAENGRAVEQHGPRYTGEDTRDTSRKELAGWYSYGWAAEVFIVCGVGSFIPITLEQLAREWGVLLSDKTTPCRASSDPSPAVDPTSAVSALLARGAPHADKGQCVIFLLGLEINTASFAMYTFSLSVLIQALLIISMSGAADHGNYRKTFLIGLGLMGAVSTMLFLPMVPRLYLVAGLLAIIANVCCGASFVLLNSFLPLLVRYHPTTRAKSAAGLDASRTSLGDQVSRRMHDEEDDEAREGDPLASSTAALLPGSAARLSSLTMTSRPAASPELQLSTEISSYGMGIGYIAAVFVQTALIGIVILNGSSTFSLRLSLFVVGAWWFAFTIPAAMWLRPRPGPPLVSGGGGGGGKDRSWLGYIAFAWTSLGRTVLRARRLKDVVLFLMAWFLLSDGISCISGTAVLFAKTELKMKPAALALISLIGTLSGVAGAFSWARLSRWAGLRPSQTILLCICLFEVIPLYGLLGYIPAIRRLGMFGLQQPWEMYPLGALYGFGLGGISSYCRSLFGELIPPGSEAAFYALYAITDKGSSVFGPAIVGLIIDGTGSIRPAFIFLAVLLALPVPLMWAVDVDRGRREGRAMAKHLGGVAEDDEVAEAPDREQRTGLLHDEADGAGQ
ncbi:MAG: Autophagy protein 22 [Thelocarpon impressellum]|nr:MAG: Autophagy protein 22 [Thelocarpon impressellum]